MSELKAAIFDIGDVLALGPNLRKDKGSNKGVHQFVADKLNISIDQYFDSIDTSYAKSIEGKLNKREVLKIMAKNFKSTPKKIENYFVEAYNKLFVQNTELYNFAFKLKKEGYKIAILSDQWHVSKEALMPKKHIKKFDEVVVSCDDGIRKPNMKSYKLILKRLKLKPKETLFIDNQIWNIIPAKKLGMKTVLFKNNKQLFKQLEKFKLFN